MYLLLKPAIDDREPEQIVFDEILKIIELASPENLLFSLRIMYHDRIKVDTPMEFNSLFAEGIILCGFLEFCEIIRGLNGSSRK